MLTNLANLLTVSRIFVLVPLVALLFAMAASGSLLAGVMLNLIEWKELNLVAVPLLLVSIMTLVWHQSRKPSESQKIPSVLSSSGN